jgi:hypothetical protein
MYKVYWSGLDGTPYSKDFDKLGEALKESQDLRNMGRSFVTMVSEDPNQVGKSGVDAVVNGKLPDGSVYDWTKKDRVGSAFKS